MTEVFPKDAVALVTGAGGGIGRATAEAFARNGVKVLVSDISQGSVEATAAAITAAGGVAAAVAADVSQEDDIRALVEKTVATFGRLDYGVNNAGINIEFTQSYDLGNFDRTLAVNCRGVFMAMKYEVEAMMKTGGGAIVNTASIHGLVANHAQPGYVASKHAVVGLSRQGALQFASSGIRVNAVCPGIIKTPMTSRPEIPSDVIEQYAKAATAMGRLGQPEEVAEAILWLCSPKASFVTGHALVVDGGFTAA